MPQRSLIEAWAALLALSLGTVLLTRIDASGRDRAFLAAGVLMLAGLKARVILIRYLGLAGSRFWTGAFDLAIGAFLLLGFALHTFGTKG
jgi:hypothetical protein